METLLIISKDNVQTVNSVILQNLITCPPNFDIIRITEEEFLKSFIKTILNKTSSLTLLLEIRCTDAIQSLSQVNHIALLA
jgi:hypothetical protein